MLDCLCVRDVELYLFQEDTKLDWEVSPTHAGYGIWRGDLNIVSLVTCESSDNVYINPFPHTAILQQTTFR